MLWVLITVLKVMMDVVYISVVSITFKRKGGKVMSKLICIKQRSCNCIQNIIFHFKFVNLSVF